MDASIEGRKAARETGSGKANVRRRRRMAAEDREAFILREATAYFAERGLSAGTIELARRIGITQPLLYKYFDTKDALITRVYERLSRQNWDPSWEALIDDDAVPLRDRLKLFYLQYATSVLTYEHVRLFLFSGLSRNEFNSRYYSLLTETILERIARALRRAHGPAGLPDRLDAVELERVQSLHAMIYHLAFRRWVHGEQLGEEMETLVAEKVDLFLDGARRSLAADACSRRNA